MERGSLGGPAAPGPCSRRPTRCRGGNRAAARRLRTSGPAFRVTLARLVLLSVLLGAPVSLAAQGPIRAVRTPEPPKLDGRPDDAVWQRAPPYTDFVEQFPDEGRVPTAPFRTEVRVLYDDRTLYIL